MRIVEPRGLAICAVRASRRLAAQGRMAASERQACLPCSNRQIVL